MTPQRIAEEILNGSHRMLVDLRSTLDISDEVFEGLQRLAAERPTERPATKLMKFLVSWTDHEGCTSGTFSEQRLTTSPLRLYCGWWVNDEP